MPVQVLDEDGNPVSNLLSYPGISQTQTSYISGIATIKSLAATTIGLFAQTPDNKIGWTGFAPHHGLVTVNLIPFYPANNTTDIRLDNGLAGWTGGAPENLTTISISKCDLALVVSTSGAYNLQTTTRAERKVYPFTKSVYIKFKFKPNEVPEDTLAPNTTTISAFPSAPTPEAQSSSPEA
ncbi:hypothetical protein QBC38DRAFT_459255 [Podospora fimiseda]|uniref:Uncharacterized protein n=1 Tax=Podospora fimiseda TaxID=252190 RepID=A0AAN7GNX6_9PEZI|nr:hypothetical protein QBC38DRAFT_459255 [Podospora fimiseda]